MEKWFVGRVVTIMASGLLLLEKEGAPRQRTLSYRFVGGRLQQAQQPPMIGPVSEYL